MIDTGRYPEYDVVVAGGGMAGVGAAVAAARLGARTVLVDQNGWLGGIGVTGATGLHTFYNVFGAHAGAPRYRLVGGIPQELVDRVMRMGGGIGHIRMERGADFVSMLTPVEPETFKLAAAELCLEAGVRLLLHTVVDEVRASQGHVDGVMVWNKAGRSLLRGKVYIDCTGDGDLAAGAGAPYHLYQADEPGAYHAGYTFRMCNVDLTALEADLLRKEMLTQAAHAVKPGMNVPDVVRLGIDMRRLREQGEAKAPGYFLSSSLRPREITYCNCVNYGPNNGLDVDALAAAETALRRQMFEVVEVFRRNFAGCEQAYAAGAAPTAGQRRARAINCLYEITTQDVTTGARFADEVGLFGFIDNPHDFVKQAGAYGFPYRALLPKDVDNLLIAGRMMTVDLPAHNSTRNTVACMVCGQGAGTGAALAVKNKIAPSEVDYGVLRAELAGSGVILEPVLEP